jgi:ABC-2 type transport system permease protein
MQSEKESQDIINDGGTYIMREALILSLLREEVVNSPLPVHQKIYALVQRGSKIFWSYKSWVVLDLISTIFAVLLYHYVSLIISPEEIEQAGYGISFFTFALIGVAFQQYVYSSVNTFSHNIHHEQADGTLEPVLATKTPFSVFLIGEGVFSFLYATYFLIASLSFGVVLFETTLTTNLWSLLSVVILTGLMILTHICIGILSVGIIIKVKEGDPIIWLFSWASMLVSGIYYPIGLLPDYLVPVAKILPLTYSLDGIRRCLISTNTGAATLLTPIVLRDVIALLIFIVILLPLSLRVFRWGYDAARREGTLHSY